MNENEEIMNIIAAFKWTFAKTMAFIPHWYTVRQKDNKELNEMYEKLYHYIQDNHYLKSFKGKMYKYCDIGEYTYWAMTDDITDSIIINRVPIKKNNFNKG